jgi:hypothetical protein
MGHDQNMNTKLSESLGCRKADSTCSYRDKRCRSVVCHAHPLSDGSGRFDAQSRSQIYGSLAGASPRMNLALAASAVVPAVIGAKSAPAKRR